MLKRNTLPSPVRRFAAGVDVSAQEERLVVACRAGRAGRPVSGEWMGTAPLATGAVAATLSSLYVRWPHRRALRGVSE
ncbi:hypothetical protein [Trinickia acidisoli]|uniref:hypothetical protein n=1 Tax=Trinickia acidisoli TaxID=2767482 RepID=UPI001A8FFFCE|nr:hypothetical protein [Trinickia acidisoli]